MIQFLIDECLSLRLVESAATYGYNAYHVTRRGWSGKSDDFLLEPMLRNHGIHPGVLVIPGSGLAEQIALFEVGLQALLSAGLESDITNKVIAVDGPDEVRIYDLPD